jgi:hypothetical protein
VKHEVLNLLFSGTGVEPRVGMIQLSPSPGKDKSLNVHYAIMGR